MDRKGGRTVRWRLIIVTSVMTVIMCARMPTHCDGTVDKPTARTAATCAQSVIRDLSEPHT